MCMCVFKLPQLLWMMIQNYHDQFYMPSNPKVINNKDKGYDQDSKVGRTQNSSPAMSTPNSNYLPSNYLWEQSEASRKISHNFSTAKDIKKELSRRGIEATQSRPTPSRLETHKQKECHTVAEVLPKEWGVWSHIRLPSPGDLQQEDELLECLTLTSSRETRRATRNSDSTLKEHTQTHTLPVPVLRQ